MGHLGEKVSTWQTVNKGDSGRAAGEQAAGVTASSSSALHLTVSLRRLEARIHSSWKCCQTKYLFTCLSFLVWSRPCFLCPTPPHTHTLLEPHHKSLSEQQQQSFSIQSSWHSFPVHPLLLSVCLPAQPPTPPAFLHPKTVRCRVV